MPNIAVFSDGFAMQNNSAPRNQRSIQFDDDQKSNDIYDLHRHTIQSPGVPENFAPSHDGYVLSPLYPHHGALNLNNSLGSSLVGEPFGIINNEPLS